MTSMPSDRTSTLSELPARGAPAPSRIRVLTAIAKHYADLVDPLNGPGDIAGDGGSVIRMPKTYTATVREFERLLRTMREDHSSPLIRLEDGTRASVRQLAWHLREYHLNATKVIRHRPIVKKRHGKQVRLINQDGSTATRPEARMLRHPQAQEHLAHQGLLWIAANWALRTEPMLPDELRDAA